MSKLLLLILILGALVSCQKTPGQGGNAQITGTYWTRKHDPFYTVVTGRYPAINQSVYLFFGDETSPGTSVKTNDKGGFQFNYLRKGKYRVVAYSKQYQPSGSNLPNEFAVETVVNIDTRKQIKNIGLDTLNQ